MAEAVFLVDIDASVAEVHRALTTKEGIVSWWTTDADRSDDVMSLGFPGAPARFALRVDAEDDSQVRWTSVGEFPPHWQDTEIVWNLMDNPDVEGTRLFFEHKGFSAPDPMLGHTAFTWANLMGALKTYSESGEPGPFFDF